MSNGGAASSCLSPLVNLVLQLLQYLFIRLINLMLVQVSGVEQDAALRVVVWVLALSQDLLCTSKLLVQHLKHVLEPFSGQVHVYIWHCVVCILNTLQLLHFLLDFLHFFL